MKFRPCIDLHDGKVKQIIGSSLRDTAESGQPEVSENFVSAESSADFARRFQRDGLAGGHVIMLGKSEANRDAAVSALRAWPGGMQVGGGIDDQNCTFYLDAGASHVIVTSYIFRGGRIDMTHLKKISAVCGREKLVLDLSCMDTENGYRIATDRWQTLTDTAVNRALLTSLAPFCDEFLVHAVSVEGKKGGIDPFLVKILADSPIPVTYAGGIASLADIEQIQELGGGAVDFTVGSALDLFGGSIPYDVLKNYQ